MSDKNILDTIGNTPLVKIGSLIGKEGAAILAKLEFLNPGGSIKDRMALYMIKIAEQKGILEPGMAIIEATSGNTGIAFAMIAALKGYKMAAVMPEDMSLERRQIMEAFGAEVVLTPAGEGPEGAIRKRDGLAKDFPNTWIPDQFGNQDNIAAHQKSTGREIAEQTGGRVDAFVAGVGTGGTLMGVAQALRKINPEVFIVGVEPAESAVLSGGRAGRHGIPGIGEGFIPKLVNLGGIDEIIKVKSSEAVDMTKRLAGKEGILAGISSGANMVASLRLARRLGKRKVIVTVLPDRGERYLSTNLFRT